MKKICLSVMIAVLISLCAAAQDAKTAIHELGINFNSLNSFGLRYKTGNENTLLRMTFLSLNGNNENMTQNSQDYFKNSSYGVGFNVGFEKRKAIAEKLYFYMGCDLLTSYTYQKSEYVQTDQISKASRIMPGVGLVLGFDYAISSRIDISAEVVPSINYAYTPSSSTSNGIETKTTSNVFLYGLNSSAASLTISCRFGKKE